MPRLATPILIDITAAIDDLPHWLTIPEAAAYMRRSTRAIRRWEALGLLRVVRPASGNPLVSRDEIARLLSDGTR